VLYVCSMCALCVLNRWSSMCSLGRAQCVFYVFNRWSSMCAQCVLNVFNRWKHKSASSASNGQTNTDTCNTLETHSLIHKRHYISLGVLGKQRDTPRVLTKCWQIARYRGRQGGISTRRYNVYPLTFFYQNNRTLKGHP
jgi:hypothetical protein